MFKVKNNMAPNIFNNNIKTISHKYHTKYSIINFNEPLKTTNYCKYAISSRGTISWIIKLKMLCAPLDWQYINCENVRFTK